MAAPVKIITIENACNCSPYELRQELNKRGAFDIEEKNVTFKTLLQRLMVELVKDKVEKEEVVVANAHSSALAASQAAKEAREEKKRLALEKSKARQSDPNYFASRVNSNEEAKKRQAEKAAQDALAAIDGDEELEEEDTDNKAAENDPFRSYASKSRSKIFVK